MSAPVEPESSSSVAAETAPNSLPAPQRISQWWRKVIEGLADGAMIRRRKGGAVASPHDAMLRLTFGNSHASQLAGLSRSEVRKSAPILFSEAFEDAPTEARRNGLAAMILGTPGIVLMLAMIIAAAICIDVQLMQSNGSAKGGTNAPATTNPADTPASAPAPLSKSITLPELDPLSKLRPDSANQAAPRPPQPSGKASASDAQPQQLQQLDPRK